MSAHDFNVKRWAILYARIALGTAFLSGIADRFGLWGKATGYGDFAHFVQYTAQVNSFMPAFTIPFLAWAATVADLLDLRRQRVERERLHEEPLPVDEQCHVVRLRSGLRGDEHEPTCELGPGFECFAPEP